MHSSFRINRNIRSMRKYHTAGADGSKRFPICNNPSADRRSRILGAGDASSSTSLSTLLLKGDDIDEQQE